MKKSKIFFTVGLLLSFSSFFACVNPSSILIDAPQNLTVSSITSTSCTLSWDSVYGSIKYSVYVNTTNNCSSALLLGNTTSTGVNISDLDSYSTYYFWIYANSISGKGYSSDVAAATTLIGSPESLTATKTSSKSIKLNWSTVENCDSYILYKSTTSSIDDATSYEIKNVDSISSETDSKVSETEVEDTGGVYFYWLKCQKDGQTSTNQAFAFCRMKSITYKFGLSSSLSTSTSGSYFDFSSNMSMTPDGNNVFFFTINPSSSSSKKTSGAAILASNNSISTTSLSQFDNDYPTLSLKNASSKKATSRSSATSLASATSRSATNDSATNESVTTLEQDFFSQIESTKLPPVNRTDKKEATDFNSETHDFSSGIASATSTTPLLNSRSAKSSSSTSTSTESTQTATSRSSTLESTTTFYVDDSDGNFSSKTAILKATSTNCNIWVLSDYFSNSSSSDSDNLVSTSQLETLTEKFETIYDPETAIFGCTYKDYGSDISGYVTRSEKINILVLDIDEDYSAFQTSGTLGYFWGKDLYYDSAIQSSGCRSNECEMFYIDSYFLDRYPEFVYSTLAHEFQHMLHFVHKTMINGVSSTTWFNEMLSMICEDLLSGSDYLNTSDEYSPKSRLTYFNAGYALLGLTEWSSDYTAYSYANAYAFGAWLTRNYGGAKLVKSMASNEYVDLECILQAIYDCGGGTLTVAELLRQFTRSICYPELTNTQYTSAGGSCSSTNYLKPFCASDTHSITSSATGTSYEITLTPIQLSDYYYIIDNKYYITPYYYDAGYAYYLSNYGEVVIDLGATTSTKAYYITGSSSTKSYFVIQ